MYDDGRATIQGEFVKDDFVEKEFNGQETVLSDFTKREIIERVVDDIENYVQNKGKITHAELDKYIEHLNNNASRNAELERYYREDSTTENFNAWKEAKKIYKNTMKSALKELGYEYDNEKNAFVKHYELPKTEDEVWTNVEARISSEIEKDMKWFVDNNFQNYERVDGEYVEDYVNRLITEIYTPAELEYIYDKDFGNEVFFAVKETLDNFIVEKGYTSEQDTGEIVPHYEPDISFLENSDEIRMEYGRLPSTDFEFAQLDKIRDEIQALVWDIKDTLPNNIDITYDESGASADATYVTLYNEDTDETYEIRVGNHFKWGTSGEADEHIRISDFSTITKLKKAVKEAIENGLIDLGAENVDIIQESDYNGYKVTRKDEPNNYVYKRITDKDRARVNSDYMLNKAKYEDDVGVVNFDDVSYAYEIGNGNIEIISKFKGSQKFINSVEEAWKNGIDNLSNGNTKIIESIRSTKRESNTSNGDGRRQEKSRTSDRQNIGYGRQQRNVNSTEINKNNGNNLENSEQSSFSLPKTDNQGRTLTKEQQEYFKDSKVRDENGNLKTMYHGTQRADRVGNYFNPEKATSGPMVFFTDNEQIASNYANDKSDTSLSREYDTEKDLFKINGKNIDDYWASLSSKEKQEINEKGKYIGFDEDWKNIIFDKNSDSFSGQYEYYLKNETNNNGIEALYKLFIEDGNLFGENMKNFSKVLELAGIKNVDYLDLYKVDKKVYNVYLNIKKPFETNNISNDIINQFEKASENATIGEQYSADMWDKSNISPKAWLERLYEDIENDTTHAWTIIPDWVTDVLKENGYDGIIDTGGKNGGIEHQVAIPFYSEQIKNVDNTNPTTGADIRYSQSDKSWSKYLKEYWDLMPNSTKTFALLSAD